MKPPIRTFLLINLLLSALLIASLAIIGNIFFARKDIQSQLDQALISSGLRVKLFLSNIDTPGLLSIKQKEINHLAAEQSTTDIGSPTAFQVWGKNGQIALHSINAPKSPLSNATPGLSTRHIGTTTWRVYTLLIPKQQRVLMIAEPSSFRVMLENRLTRDSTLIMLLTYPFLGLLIWIIVGRGLAPLKRIASEIEQRVPSHLKPVDIQSVPKEIKPLITSLNHLFERLLDAFNREKRFTADAAHELRTPLAAITAHAQVALKTTDPEDLKQTLNKMVTSVTRSTHIIAQLLTLTRMVPEASINDPVRMNLETEAATIAAQLVPDALEKDIEVELIATGSEKPFINGNPTAIGILTRNLIDNAIRYSPKGSLVSIRIKSSEQYVTLSVIDNGPGIPQELRERVFERFYRILGNQATGSGLGLGIVMQIAKLHNADISLDTPTSGKGLKFSVTFCRIN